MNSLEIRAAISLASIFALRMLGLFLILPVFAIHAKTLPGYDITLVGWVLGIYGLTQGLLQIPFGMASDRFGRKPVMTISLSRGRSRLMFFRLWVRAPRMRMNSFMLAGF